MTRWVRRLVAIAAMLPVTPAVALAYAWWPRLGPTDEPPYPVAYVVACVPYGDANAADGVGWSCVDDARACLWPGVP